MIKPRLKKVDLPRIKLVPLTHYCEDGYWDCFRLACEMLYGFSETKLRILKRKDFIWHSSQSPRSSTETHLQFLQTGSGADSQEIECAQLGTTHLNSRNTAALLQEKNWHALLWDNRSNFAPPIKSTADAWSVMCTSLDGTWQTISRGTGRKGITMEEH